MSENVEFTRAQRHFFGAACGKIKAMDAPLRLSAPQLEQFERDGFLHLPALLCGTATARYLQITRRMCDDFRAESGLGADQTVEIRNAVARDDALLDLISHPVALGAMLDILGWNIQLTTSHVFARTPNPDAAPDFKAITWHADGSNPHPPRVEGAEGAVEPRLYAKIGYFLTDLSAPNQGNLRVVPGSHRRAARPATEAATGEPRGMVELLTRPGDAVIFENRCWHAVGPNLSREPRQNIYIGYCHRWMKAIDFQSQSPELLQRANSVQRQLLGAASHPLSFYLPDRAPADVPLRAWA